jgi:hypothetical protein
MIQITPQMRILVAKEPIDFRKGIDGLCRICRTVMESDPGFWLCQKRLSKGRFQWWPGDAQSQLSALAVHELQLLIWNGDPRRAHVAPLWKKIT